MDIFNILKDGSENFKFDCTDDRIWKVDNQKINFLLFYRVAMCSMLTKPGGEEFEQVEFL